MAHQADRSVKSTIAGELSKRKRIDFPPDVGALIFTSPRSLTVNFLTQVHVEIAGSAEGM